MYTYVFVYLLVNTISRVASMLLELCSRTLCCYRKTCCGIRLENGCLIFAIFNAMVVTSFLTECLYFIVWLMVIQPVFRNYDHEESDEYIVNLIYGVVLTSCASVCLFFAVLLCYGILRKERKHVKTYFIFGVVVEALGLLCTLAFMARGNLDEGQKVAIFAALIVCGVYPFLLLLVRRTYKAMNKSETDDSQQKLISHYNK